MSPILSPKSPSRTLNPPSPPLPLSHLLCTLQNYGIHLGTEMCKKLLAAGTPGLHMYTLNLDGASVSILKNLGLISSHSVPRSLPWRPSANINRVPKEGVRPIYWGNRRHSYLSRTADWESFPAGRWASCLRGKGGAMAPAEESLMSRPLSSDKRREKALAAWGSTVSSIDDVNAVFAKYLKGEIKQLPWTDSDKLQVQTVARSSGRGTASSISSAALPPSRILSRVQSVVQRGHRERGREGRGPWGGGGGGGGGGSMCLSMRLRGPPVCGPYSIDPPY